MPEVFIADPALDDIPFQPLTEVLSLWQQQVEAHSLPARVHFTPQMLKAHLPYLVLMDHEQETGRFKVRLIGTRYTEAIGFESTGMYVDELPNATEMQERYEWLVREKKPYYAYLDKMVWAGKNYRHYGVIGCPLFDESGEVNMILFRVTFERPDALEQQRAKFSSSYR